MRPEPLHFTQLKRMAQSPAHYKAALLHSMEPTPAMRLGTLVHCILLGGDFTVYEGERRGHKWKDFAAENEGKTIVTLSEVDRATACAEAVRAHPIAPDLLKGRHEVTVNWRQHGRECQGRVDVIGDGFITELKTASCTEPWRFTRGALRLSYHAQLAWYQDACAAIGEDPFTAYIVSVETAPPYAVTVFRMTPRALEDGRKLTRLWLETLLTCERCDEWPAYAQSIVDFDSDGEQTLIIDGEEIAA